MRSKSVSWTRPRWPVRWSSQSKKLWIMSGPSGKQMPNDESQMSKEARKSKSEWKIGAPRAFELRHSSFVRHLIFDIRHSWLSGRLLLAILFPRIVVHELHPDFALLQLLCVHNQVVHIPRAGRRHDPLAVELE